MHDMRQKPSQRRWTDYLSTLPDATYQGIFISQPDNKCMTECIFGGVYLTWTVKVKVLVYSLVLAATAIHTTLQALHYLSVRELH